MRPEADRIRPAEPPDKTSSERMHFSERYQSGQYLASAPDWHARDSKWKAEKVFRSLSAHALNVRTVCDVGCGAGEVLAHLQRHMGTDVYLTGYDIAAEAIALSKPKENEHLRFRHGDFLRDDTAHYDALLALDVFEHVPDYLGFLKALSRRADNFVFHIPLDINASTVLQRSKYMMHMRKTFGHLHYFTAETAIATLEDTGFSVVDREFTWDREMGLFSRPPKGVLARGRHWLNSSVLLAERFTNKNFPNFWPRVRAQYNLLVFAKPRTPEN